MNLFPTDNDNACYREYKAGKPCSTSLMASEFPTNRSCEMANIPRNYCSCYEIEIIKQDPAYLKFAQKIAIKLIDSINTENGFEMNRSKDKFLDGNVCAKLDFLSILSVQKVKRDDPFYSTMVLQFVVTPRNATFEAYIEFSEFNPQETSFVIGKLHRIDTYAGTSTCTTELTIKEICICQ